MSPKHQAYIKRYKQQIKMNFENLLGYNKFSKSTIAFNFNLLQALSIRDSVIFDVLFIPSFNV